MDPNERYDEDVVSANVIGLSGGVKQTGLIQNGKHYLGVIEDRLLKQNQILNVKKNHIEDLTSSICGPTKYDLVFNKISASTSTPSSPTPSTGGEKSTTSSSLPTNLESLTFNDEFNQIIQVNTLPTNLQSLTFGYEFNQIIQPNTLPTNLQSLTFGKQFNQIIQSNTLPTNLESLTFGNRFNQIIQSNSLPTNLQSLTFGNRFNQTIRSNTLPTNLESLTFGDEFNQIILPNTLPTNLQSLTFGYYFNQIIQSNTLPTNLESLTFGDEFNQIILPNTFPTNLQSLTFGYWFNQIIQSNTLPTNLQSLTFGNQFNLMIESNTLPTNLESLTFGYEFNQIIESNTLPTNLKSLTFGRSFNQIIQENTLPTNLQSLTFGDEFNQIIQSNTLPTNLQSLTFGRSFNQIIQPNTLPTNLQSLILGEKYTKLISVNELPTNLKLFKINNTEYPFLLKRNKTLKIEIPNHIFTINSKRYHILESHDIGINQVYLVDCEQSHQLLICKLIEYSRYGSKKRYSEGELMKLLKGYDNFVQLIYDYYDELNFRYYLFIEHYPKGDLHKLFSIRANQTYFFPEETIWDYLSQLFSILNVLEYMKIDHCDIKPENIYLSGDDRLILGGFGYSKLHLNTIIHPSNTQDLIEIEVDKNIPYQSSIDILSVGSTILRLLSCHKEDIDNYDKFIQDKNNIIISPERYSQKLIDFVKTLVLAKREDRQSLQMILNSELNLIKNKQPSILTLDSERSKQIGQLENENLNTILNENPQIDYKKSNLIGKGTYGRVYFGYLKTPSQINVAIKRFDIIPNAANDSYYRRLDHPNIVKYICACVNSENGTPKHLNIFLEYCSGGTIAGLLNNQLSESTVSKYTKQILSALKYLHENNIIHRDIKGSNILLDANGNIKLADFGCSKYYEGMSISSTIIGTRDFIAPEVLNGGYGRSSDIFSLGCTIIQMITANSPKIIQISASIGTLKSGIPYIPPHISEDLKDFLNLCLKINPNERSTATELLNHEFISNYNF